MLVLARRIGEEIVIDGNIRVTVLETRGSQVRLGVMAPQSVRVLRQEVLDRQAGAATAAPLLAKSEEPRLNDSRIMAGVMSVAR